MPLMETALKTMQLPDMDPFVRPDETTHVDHLDKRWYIREGDEAIGALCENISEKYPDTKTISVVSSSGVEYRETPVIGGGFVYHQFYHWATAISVFRHGPFGIIQGTWERRCGFLPIFTSPKRLDGIRLD